MKVMALIYDEEGRWDSYTDEEKQAVYARYGTFGKSAGDAVLGGAELASTRDATTVRVRNDETLVTDGPYTEVKEALGGFYVLEVDSMDQALDLAARIPGAETGAVEVRPIYIDPAEVQL